MSTTVRRALFAVIVIGVVVLALESRRPEDSRSSGERSVSSQPGATRADGSGAAAQLSPFTRESAAHGGQRSDSLDGTDVAGGFLVDADGNFQPTADAITLFEYFLSALGEKPEADVVERIRAEIRRRLSPPAEAQALAFLDAYLTYRERAVALAATDAGEEDLRARFDRLRALRREIFGEEVAARLFVADEAVADVAIRQREVAADPALSDAEKAERIEQLYDELPEPMREARAKALAATRLREDEARIRGEGGSEEDIRALRVERFGEEGADRLEDLDARRAAWGTRLAAFRSERARILADPALTAQQRSAAIARLLAESFEEAERIRVEALDRVAAESGSPD